MSQEALARLVGCSLRTAQEIEASKTVPNVLLALRIAGAVGAKVEDLWRSADEAR